MSRAPCQLTIYINYDTYKISGELVVYENCELEFVRDAVLNFDPTYTKTVYDEETGGEVVTVIPYEEFKCITLNPSSRLIGNHATIRVPYYFKGNAICIAANPEDDTGCNGPRYLKDINIVKAIEQKSDNSIDSELVGNM